MNPTRYKGGGPAFPCEVTWDSDANCLRGVQTGNRSAIAEGLSIRDYFAAMALQGLLTKLPLVDQQGEHGIKVEDKIRHNLEIAHSCYCLADAMLEAREQV